MFYFRHVIAVQKGWLTQGWQEIDETHLLRLIQNGFFCCRCDECGRGFKVIKDLMKHKKKPHTAEYLAFKHPCPIDKCGKRFRKEVALKRHMLLHQGVRPFKCDHCDQAFHIKQVTSLSPNRTVLSTIKTNERLSITAFYFTRSQSFCLLNFDYF